MARQRLIFFLSVLILICSKLYANALSNTTINNSRFEPVLVDWTTFDMVAPDHAPYDYTSITSPNCKNNLLRNASFEQQTATTPPYWEMASASIFSTTSNYAVIGNWSASLYHTGTATGQIYQQVAGILPGNNYHLSFYGGTHQPSYKHTVKIEFYNSFNTLLETSTIIEVDKDIDGNNTLAPYVLDAIAPPTTSYLKVVGSAEKDYLILDELCLTTDQARCDNRITNSDFNKGITDWTFKTSGTAKTTASLIIDNSHQLSGAISALINIQEANQEISDIQLLQDGLSFISGEEYQVSFQAKANLSRSITIALQKTSTPNTVYERQIFNLTNRPNTYSFLYTPNSDNVEDLSLVFQFGGNEQEVYIDNINFAIACNLLSEEICDNGIDDDGDGLIDREDSDCPYTCEAPTLIFENPSTINASNNGIGAIYKFDNVLAGIDATIEVINKSHEQIKILNIDAPGTTGEGYDQAFQPTIDYNWLQSDGSYDAYGQRWVEFELSFFETGSVQPINVPLFSMTPLDIDGNGDGLREFFETQNFDTYHIQSPTSLSLSNRLRALGAYANQDGIDDTAIASMISFDFSYKHAVTFRYGATYDFGTHGNEEEIINALSFQCYQFNTAEYCPTIIIEGDPSVCPGSPVNLTATIRNTSGYCNLQWESSSNGTDWLAIPGATATNLSAINTTRPTYYRLSIYCNNSPLCGAKYSQAHFVGIASCAEICNNGFDDDLDGLIDCADEDCPTPSIASVQFTDPSDCLEFDNGTITIIPTIEGDVEYSIDSGATYQSAEKFTDLGLIAYHIFLRDKQSQCAVAYDRNPFYLTAPACIEICDNDIDDDGDGLIDCEDGDCSIPVIQSVTTSTPNNCPALDNGTITILASGELLQYSIDNGVSYQSSPTFSQLVAGTYTILVQNTITTCTETATTNLDDANCIEVCNDGIDNNGDGQVDCADDACGQPKVVEVLIKMTDNCPQATNGSITIIAAGANLAYSIDDGNSFQDDNLFSNLTPGNFNIVVKNKLTDCIDRQSDTNTIPVPTCEEICDNNIDDDGNGRIDCEDRSCGNPTISNVVSTAPTNCPGSDNGTITITATGRDLQYSIDGGVSYQASNTFTNLIAETYFIQVKNNIGGCTTTYSNNPMIINQPNCVEICGNGIDDDGDGAIDFQDFDCGATKPPVIFPQGDWLCEGTDYTFEVPFPATNFTYDWYFGTYASQSIARGPGPHTVQFTPPIDTDIFPRVILIASTTNYAIQDTFDFLIRPVLSISNVTSILPSDCEVKDGSLVIEVNNAAACFEISLDGGNTWKAENKDFFDKLAIGNYNVLTRYCDATCASESKIISLTDPSLSIKAGNDHFDNICPDQTFTNTVIENDTVNSLNTTYKIISPTVYGTIEMDAKGTFEYTPTGLYCGMDDFSYSVCGPNNTCCVTALVLLNLEDTNAPVLQNVPTDIFISYDEEIPLPAIITAYDGCPSITIEKEEISTQGTEACALYEYQITRSWTATDLCRNSKTAKQIINVADITAPDIFRIYTLPNGKKLIAGVMENVHQEWKTIPFPIAFDQAPLVFTQVVSTEDISPVITRIRNTSTTNFELRLQEEENGDQVHTRESVAWIAIEAGTQTADYLLETGTVEVDHNWETINFENDYSAIPLVFTGVQSFNEQDPSVTSIQSLRANGFNCKLTEETSKDLETAHQQETLAYLTIGNTGNISDEKGHIIGESGRLFLDHNRVTITPKNKYYNPVIITQNLTNNGSDATIQRINLKHSTSFEIQLQKWDYLDGNNPFEEIAYLIIEGSIPLDASASCTNISDPLEIGKDIVVLDNCDPNSTLQYEERNTLSGANRQTVRSWYTEDVCGNQTNYTQVINCASISLQIKVLLQGALVNNNGQEIMRDDLRRLDLLPLEEPYSDYKEFTHVGQGGKEKADPFLFQETGGQAIVDWVFIELKNADNLEVVATKSALLHRDGNVVMMDGSPIINFLDVPDGDYYIKLRHRNHIALETLYPYGFDKNNIPLIDFTNADLPVRGRTPRVSINGQLAAWSGDLNGDNETVFQGPNNDVFHMFLNILGDEMNVNNLSNFISRGYTNKDFNMDGTVIFQGPNNDRSLLLWNTIFSHPKNVSNQSNFILSTTEIVDEEATLNCLNSTQFFCDFDNDGIPNGSDPDDDNDGVTDGNDIAPYDRNSDTDRDGISDNEETGNDGVYNPGIDTNPLSACDPYQDDLICEGEDLDGDGFFANYPLDHKKHDQNDQNACEPNGVVNACSCPDADGDGFILICSKTNESKEGRTISIRINDWPANNTLENTCGPCADETNTPSSQLIDTDNDGYFLGILSTDSDDENPCIPNIFSFACQPIDKDLDGYFGNADPNSDDYDLDDNNACVPIPTTLCIGIDHDGDTYYGNYPHGHPSADPNENDPCIPNIEKCSN